MAALLRIHTRKHTFSVPFNCKRTNVRLSPEPPPPPPPPPPPGTSLYNELIRICLPTPEAEEDLLEGGWIGGWVVGWVGAWVGGGLGGWVGGSGWVGEWVGRSGVRGAGDRRWGAEMEGWDVRDGGA